MQHWTPERWCLAQQMRRAHRSYREIAETLGMNQYTVWNRFNRELHGAPRRKFRIARPNHPPQVPPNVLSDRDLRVALARTRTDLTASLCGDPLPGYSALDRRG